MKRSTVILAFQLLALAGCSQEVERSKEGRGVVEQNFVVTLADGGELRGTGAQVHVLFWPGETGVEVSMSAMSGSSAWAALANADPSFLQTGKLEAAVTDRPLTVGQGAVQKAIGDEPVVFAPNGTLSLTIERDHITGEARGMEDRALAATFQGPVSISCSVTQEALAEVGVAISAPVPVEPSPRPVLIGDTAFASRDCRRLADDIPQAE
jgi:hypothetical protein